MVRCMNDPIRHTLERLIKERGESYAGLSHMLGRNPAYLQQFVKRGSPRKLDEQDRIALAKYFNVRDDTFEDKENAPPFEGTVKIPRLKVQVSAGPGSLVDNENAAGFVNYDKKWLKSISSARFDLLSIVKVSGDSMSPSLLNGDDIIIEKLDLLKPVKDGIYVIRREEDLIIKRVTLNPVSKLITISSDNSAFPTFYDVNPNDVILVGRAIWVGRKLH